MSIGANRLDAMRNVIVCMAAILFSLFLGGCSPPWEDEVSITMPEDIAQASQDVSEEIGVDVYWDATYSMYGYTTLAAGNAYRTLPDELGDIGDSMGQVRFFRFGAEVMPMEGREYRKFSDPGAYTELITAVHNVVDKADPNHLSIIVTDLFESDSDWSNVTKKLKDKYFARHMAVAIIGIKNSFNGDIFDVGLNAAKFTYDSGDNPAMFRPFYLFIMGPEQSVREFMERWKERQAMPNETQYLLLSENLTESANDFSQLTLQEGGQNLYEDEQLGITDKRIKEFGINDMGSPAVLSVQFKYQPVFGACPLNMETLKSSVRVLSLEEGENGERAWQVSTMENDAKVEVVPSPDQPGSYSVTLRFTPERTLSPDRINFIHVSVAPDAKGYQLPEWVKAWNMPNVDVAPDQFDGSKTINFLHVVESLKNSALAAAHPSLVNMNLVIDNR